MSELWRFPTADEGENAKVLVGRLAAGQWGRIHARQLRGLGIGDAVMTRWIKQGYLYLVHPRVYAVGHVAESTEADLVAAILYAGSGAALAAGTCLWWRGLLKYPPPLIEVCTPRRSKPRPGLKIHGRRQPQRVWCKRLPTATVAQALLDFAATAPLHLVQYALAQADYHRVLDPDELYELVGRGRIGSKRLRQAVDNHLPELAETLSELEQAFIQLLATAKDIPMPVINRRQSEGRVDALWLEQGLIVELDGVKGHSTPHQVKRDHTRDLNHRAHGRTTHRYSYNQIKRTPEAVLNDVRLGLAR